MHSVLYCEDFHITKIYEDALCFVYEEYIAFFQSSSMINGHLIGI